MPGFDIFTFGLRKFYLKKLMDSSNIVGDSCMVHGFGVGAKSNPKNANFEVFCILFHSPTSQNVNE